MSDKADLFSWLFRRDLSEASVGFLEVLSEAAEKCLSKSRIDADAYAVANIGRYWGDVLRQVAADSQRGLIPFCEVVHSKDRLLRNACARYTQSTTARDRTTGLLLRTRPKILSAIDRLTNREYEALGSFALRTIGAKRDHLTPAGDEGGIDFIATVQLHSPCHVFSSVGKEIRIIGQSKKYESKVQVGALDAFIKTIENVRHRSDRVDRIIPAWFHASTGPIIGWMVAHEGFQAGAHNEARKHGVMLSDSRDIAEMICLSRNFNRTATADQRAAALEAGVKQLLAQSDLAIRNPVLAPTPVVPP